LALTVILSLPSCKQSSAVGHTGGVSIAAFDLKADGAVNHRNAAPNGNWDHDRLNGGR